MEQLKHRDILNVSLKVFITSLTIYTALSLFIVSSNKMKISKISLLNGDSTKEIKSFPFESMLDGDVGNYTYNFTIRNSILFSGTIHIVPNDCIKSISINDVTIPRISYSNRCDNVKGFYLNITPFLKEKNNHVSIVTKNTAGLYGLYFNDTTFYDIYFYLLLIPYLFLTINLRMIFAKIFERIIKRVKIHGKLLGKISIFIIITISIFKISGVILDYRIKCLLIFSAIYFLILNSIIKKFEYKKSTALLLTVGLFVIGSALFILPYNSFSYDHNGHLEYIMYILRTGHIPLDSAGWSFYHPSFYYITVSLLIKFMGIVEMNNQPGFLKLIQFYSFVVFVFYLFFSLKTLDFIVKITLEKHLSINKTHLKCFYIACSCLVVYWPSNFITAIRIGNDSTFTLFFVMAFYYTLKWWYFIRYEFFILALIAASFSIWSKSNGFICLILIGSLIFLMLVSQRKNCFDKTSVVLTYLLFTTFLFYYSFKNKMNAIETNTPLIVGNAEGLGASLVVQNKIETYLPFNPKKFVTEPFTNSLDEKKGRANFWFYLLKTSMFGEFKFKNIILAKALSMIMLFLILFFFAGYFFVFKVSELLPVYINIAILVISMISFRFLYPYSSSNDFRYIFPAVLPFSIIISIPIIRGNLFFSRAIPILVLLISLISTLFQLSSVIDYFIHT